MQDAGGDHHSEMLVCSTLGAVHSSTDWTGRVVYKGGWPLLGRDSQRIPPAARKGPGPFHAAPLPGGHGRH